MDYAASGVNLDRATDAKARIAAAIRTTFNDRVVTDVGHFGGCFALNGDTDGQVLVASSDGVGTKLLLGVQLGLIERLGHDLVHHCINDILMCGARPLFFLDYLAFGTLEPDTVATLVQSMAAACKAHGVALIGGETAEMPGLYAPGHFDLAGTIVGTVSRENLADKSRVRPGDILLGVASSGCHTNGYSLIRRVFSREIAGDLLAVLHLSDGRSLAEALMEPHRCYLPSLGKLIGQVGVHGMSHITGGGLVENTMRVIPEGLSLDIDWSSWERPELFRRIQAAGIVPENDMRRTFNLGIGAVVIVSSEAAAEIESILTSEHEVVVPIGRVAA